MASASQQNTGAGNNRESSANQSAANSASSGNAGGSGQSDTPAAASQPASSGQQQNGDGANSQTVGSGGSDPTPQETAGDQFASAGPSGAGSSDTGSGNADDDLNDQSGSSGQTASNSFDFSDESDPPTGAIPEGNQGGQDQSFNNPFVTSSASTSGFGGSSGGFSPFEQPSSPGSDEGSSSFDELFGNPATQEGSQESETAPQEDETPPPPPPNIAPETSAATATGLEDAPSITVQLTGSDPDGQVAQFRILTAPSDGKLYADAGLTTLLVAGGLATASGNSAILYFVPNQDFNGSQTLSYTAIDNEGLEDSSAATASIAVTSVNDAPRAAPLTLPATEDGASVSIDLMQGASDVDDANPLILDAASVLALHASMTLTGTQLAIDPTHGDFQDIAAGATRDLTVTYDIKDNQGATLTLTLTVRITGTNDGPVLSAAQAALPDGTEDNAYSLSLADLT
ncbi:MAG: Ig-like domain-containing protein [Cohaesibacter sp.]|nr:Ig-like domain-containing protein [Cohaesibacter sp.]